MPDILSVPSVIMPPSAPPVQLDCSQSVETLIAAHRSTAAVFRDHDIEMCCSLGLSITNAARSRGVDEAALCAALSAAILAGDDIVF